MDTKAYVHRHGLIQNQDAGQAMRDIDSQIGFASYKSKLRILSRNILRVQSTAGSDQYCHLLQTTKNGKTELRKLRPDGYVQLSGGQGLDAKQLNHYWHCGVMYVKMGGLAGVPKNRNYCVSHLCNHPDCGNPEHLVLEEMWRNIKRQMCIGPDHCNCDDDRGPEYKCIVAPRL